MAAPQTPLIDPAAQQPNADLARLQAELNRTQNENQQLKRQATQQPAQPAQQAPTKDSLEKTFWGDPLPMVDAIARRAVWESEQRMTASTIDTQKQIARDKVRSGDPEVFDEYEVEIAAAVAQVAPQMQGSIQVWQNGFNIVRGAHIEEITAKKMAKAKPAEGEQQVQRPAGDGPAAVSTRQPPAPKEKPLSDEQKEVARGMKLSDSEYRRGIARYANQEAEWAKVVTFDSDGSRRAAKEKK